MPAIPKDEALCKLAVNVGKYSGFTPATPEQTARCADRNSFPWVERKGKGAVFVIKPTINGGNWRIGVFPDVVTATRFADMAIRRFWKYRRYNKQAISDRQLTHSITDSIADESANPSASIYLDEIERRLIDLGVFIGPTKTPTPTT